MWHETVCLLEAVAAVMCPLLWVISLAVKAEQSYGGRNIRGLGGGEVREGRIQGGHLPLCNEGCIVKCCPLGMARPLLS